jgi:hypothetical protein
MSGFNFDAVYTHFTDGEHGRTYHYRVSINGESFDYRMGAGYFTPKYNRRGNLNRIDADERINKKFNNSLGGWLHYPTVEGVIHSLLSDMQFGEMSFAAFCDELGFNYDSVSDLGTHRDCEQNAKKLRKALTRDQINEWKIKLEGY